MSGNAILRWRRPRLVVVGTNFLEGPCLLLSAIDQAKLAGARILLVHVIECYRKPLALSESYCSVANPALHTITTQMEHKRSEFLRHGIDCETIILKGLPSEQIADLVESRSADRVIVATGTFRGNERAYAVPVAIQLAALLSVPVCIIGSHVRRIPACATDPVRVLVAISLHSANTDSVKFARSLADGRQLRLTLLHVIESGGLDKIQREAARIEAVRKLSSFISEQPAQAFQSVVSIREGDPATQILVEAETTNQGYIVLGAPAVPATHELVAGDVVHNVIADAKCPVFTIKRGNATERESSEDSGAARGSAIVRWHDDETSESGQSNLSDVQVRAQYGMSSTDGPPPSQLYASFAGPNHVARSTDRLSIHLYP